MTPVVITPAPPAVALDTSLVLSDGQTDLDLMGSPPWGLYLVEFTPPVVPRENTYSLAPEGQRRIRSRPQNAVGNARLRIDRWEESSATWQADLHALQEMVESAHKRKGTLAFMPPNLQEVTYDLESCQITEAPADGPAMTQRRQEFVVEFECKPYGRLATETLLTDEVLTGPIAGVEIPAVDGHVDALGELTITDTSDESADFVEFGLGQQGYDPDAPLLVEEDDMVISGDYVGTQPGGSGTQIECPLTADAAPCCATGEQDHNGRQKIAALIQTPDSDVWVRLGYTINRSAPSYGRWIEVTPTVSLWLELTLGVIDLGEPHAWQGWIEAFAGDGSGTLNVSQFYIIPAEVCGRIRWSGEIDEDHALWASKSMRFTYELAERQHTAAAMYGRAPLDGDTLRIPAGTASELPSLLVIRRRLYDIDSDNESEGRDAEVTATLEITPRVALY